jgi:hypothetical protein
LPILFCLILIDSFEARSQFSFNRIAVTNDSTPVFVAGNSQSMTFDSFSGPIIDLNGNVILSGSIQSPSGSEEGIWFHRLSSSQLELHAKENSAAPGLGVDAFFGSASGLPAFGPLKLENDTDYTYRARLKGGAITPENDTAVYRRGILVIREGDRFDLSTQDNTLIGDQFEFAGLGQETVRRPFPLLNTDPSSDTTFQMPGFSSPREGTEVIGDGRLGDLRSVRPVAIPRSFDEVFLGTVTDASGQSIPNDQRIFVHRFSNGPARPEVIARQGEGPSNAPNLRFDSFYHPATARNHFLFGARLSGLGVGSSNDSAVVLNRRFSDDPFVFLREGHPVAGAGPDVVLGDLGTDNLVGGGGLNFTFNNQLVGPDISEHNDWALISAGVDVRGMLDTRILAQEGDFVEGLPAGSLLAGLDAPHFQLSLMGDVIFNAEFVGPSGNGAGLFYTALEQPGPNLIVRTGQEFDIGGGVFKTVSGIGLMEISNARDGRAAQINDNGEAVFRLTFSDGSQGIFTTVVPEPGTMVLSIVGSIFVFIAAWRRRRRRGDSSLH